MSTKEIAQELLSHADVQINGNRPWDIQIHDGRFYSKILAQNSLSIGESYMDGWWDCEQLDELFNKILIAKLDKKVKIKLKLKLFIQFLKSSFLNMQSKSRSTVVAKQHYDIGNDFYSKMLDKRMQYTCGYWKNAKTLDQAQEYKLNLICKKLMLKKGEKILELGCGWGGFAKYAAEKYGVKVIAYNISKEQVNYAREICKGLPVQIIKSDYREATGTYDKIVSIGMCEHVGSKNYRTFMEVAHRCLKDRGLFLVHTIAGDGSPVDPWIEKYIFPNSMVPSIKQLGEAMEGLFVMEDWHNFGADYDKTLMAWYHNFNKNWDQFKTVYNERFYRMWKYYLLLCAGSFRSRRNQLWQIVLSKGEVPGGYKSIR